MRKRPPEPLPVDAPHDEPAHQPVTYREYHMTLILATLLACAPASDQDEIYLNDCPVELLEDESGESCWALEHPGDCCPEGYAFIGAGAGGGVLCL
jgi:hypothetical protein